MITVSPSLTSTVSLVAQEQVNRGPQGPEFGKAAPVGLLVIIGLLVVILALGYFFNRRMRKMHKRRDFADAHGLDPFDIDTIDRRMAEADAAGAVTTPVDADGQDSSTEDPGGDQR
ncbi:Putative membrane protein [Corynebacterium glyciniphilum AJ 3170]|uniref:Putative membrane protein n=1 Tax=Corynebacterium glyciniphilum AJ 3170 TaxID=1404245 RepID=X5DSM0_9CORY|nr:hypothetical protein [Corynebacterium glyciniphilum]AHW63677.1 Putative membrane protein [Corynebacterium glyciniphilum AJ 3170]